MGVKALVEARGISWKVGAKSILEPLDFGLAAGECVAIVGPNGAGKTTLLRLVAGLIEPSSGELSLVGRPYSSLPRRDLARHIAYVPQIRPARIPLTVEQLVLLGRFPYLSAFQMRPGAGDHRVVEEVLERVGLEALRERELDGLSGGERQSVFIAAALAQEAEALLLDEPTTHLDPRHQLDIVSLLMDLRSRSEHAILLTTHDLNLAARIADRVLALRAGSVVALGTPRELIRPDRLEEIYGASFEQVGDVDNPRVLLRMKR